MEKIIAGARWMEMTNISEGIVQVQPNFNMVQDLMSDCIQRYCPAGESVVVHYEKKRITGKNMLENLTADGHLIRFHPSLQCCQNGSTRKREK
jgi:hypothetical protein